MSVPRCLFTVIALLGLVVPTRADETPYDLLIRNGRIVDGTGNPWFLGDVAIRGDRIVAVGRVPAHPARRTIDAKGDRVISVDATLVFLGRQRVA